MRARRLSWVGIILAAGCLTTGTDEEAPDFFDSRGPKAELLLVGVFHFADQGLDAYKPVHRLDISSPERQRELEQLVSDLARFQPTVVAVEALRGEQRRLDSLFVAYGAGAYQLEINEVYQIGFRLAKRVGLRRVVAADAESRSYMTREEAMAKVATLGLNMDSVLKQIQSDPWAARFNRLYAYEDSIKTRRTISQHLLASNDPERIRLGHGAYVVGSFKLGPNADYLGPDDATQWYNRNLRIFSNLQSVTSGPSDRILLIIGAGHLPILRFLAQASPEYRLREPAEFITPR
ncbi:MAG TPA: DUF5694 domain-containing protein [Gemmatimonadaceae bacterium]|nr:DUF5694 domain-containing protein [Gemmatimonadaceae bacterium]